MRRFTLPPEDEPAEPLPAAASGPLVPPVQKPLAVYIRWMIRRDMPEVLAIETQAFQFPWSEDDFVRCLRNRNCIGMVAEQGERIAGFMIYELHKNRLHILSLAVHTAFRRRRVGRQMVAKLVGKLSLQRRNRIMLEVRETNVPAQVFFRACGFRAISLLRDFYEDSTEDAYLMQYRLLPAAAMPPPETEIKNVRETDT